MAVTAVLSNRFKYMRDTKQVSMSTDAFIAILMNTTFTFDPDTHSTLSDVTADQLATGNGYTQDNKDADVLSVTEDDTNDRCQTLFDDIIFEASAAGAIGPSGAMLIIDSTITESTVVGCVDFGEDLTVPASVSMKVDGVALNSN